jgi:hypothetical protein
MKMTAVIEVEFELVDGQPENAARAALQRGLSCSGAQSVLRDRLLVVDYFDHTKYGGSTMPIEASLLGARRSAFRPHCLPNTSAHADCHPSSGGLYARHCHHPFSPRLAP